MTTSSGRSHRVAVAVVAASVLGAAAFWHLGLAPRARAVVVSPNDLTVSGTGVRAERVSTGGRRVTFGAEGVLLGIPLEQEIRSRRLHLELSDVEGLAWAGVSLWATGAPESGPVILGRAFDAGSQPEILELALEDGSYRAAHVELRPLGESGQLTVQSIELRSPEVAAPPPSVLLSVGLLVGGAASLAWLAASLWIGLSAPQRRRLVAATLVFCLGSAVLLFLALTLDGIGEASAARRGLETTVGFPSRMAAELRSDLRHVALQARARDRRLPHLAIHLSPQALATLEAKRDEAIRGGGVLIAEDDDEVRGYLSLNDNEPVRIRTRLKGDWVDHLEGRAFSLRVRVRGQDAVLGMRRFSIQRPQTRVGHYEALVLEQMREEGLIAPRYAFVRFSLNDESLGVMAVEEFMSTELLEANGRREGVILALDEDLLWRQRRHNALLGTGSGSVPVRSPVGLFEAAHRSPVRTFQEGTVLRDPVLRSQYEEALGLLRGYFEGRLAPEDVFDVERLGRFFAIVNLWNADHPTWWHNVRVYFNPVTRLLEPIGFDNNVPLAPPPPGTPPRWQGSDFYHLEGSERFHQAYQETMDRLREQVRSGELEKRIRTWEAAHYARMRPGDHQDAPYPMNVMRARLAALDRVEVPRREVSAYDPGPPPSLGPDPAFAAFVHVFWVVAENGPYLEFQNITQRPVTIDAVEYAHRRLSSRVPLEIGPLEVPPGDDPDARLRVPVDYDPLDRDGRIVVTATLDARHAGHEVEARRYFPAARETPLRSASREELLERFPFVSFDPASGYRVGPGRWEVDGDMLVPADGRFTLEPGATLRFAAGTRLVLRRALTARGRADAPIRLVAREEEPWGGLVVLQAPGPSELSHVEIEGIDFPPGDRWTLTGAVTFYESDVTMTDVRIHGTLTEDALNLIRCRFHLEGFEVDGAPSDALDVDFGEGRIVRSRFLDLGGDAVDVSGTEVAVEALEIRGVRDKALSVGEGSTLHGRDLQISDVGTGVASKDGSTAEVTDSRVWDVTHVAFMAYVKKPEFGPARLTVRRVHADRVGQLAAPVGESVVEIDGRRAMRVELDVGRLYRTGYMAK